MKTFLSEPSETTLQRTSMSEKGFIHILDRDITLSIRPVRTECRGLLERPHVTVFISDTKTKGLTEDSSDSFRFIGQGTDYVVIYSSSNLESDLLEPNATEAYNGLFTACY
ncbi:hypothetical protein CHS0354_036322 [Potamilus streckersoni]|uniref:Uncharacterized protein n=1 Tax=Potamilus streckersoni TaxID=2493646 RepID=A0AAE0VEP5_9BIVA|nr:hypothetical protein CHS0354_036322 [Potamilus streckersoni]